MLSLRRLNALARTVWIKHLGDSRSKDSVGDMIGMHGGVAVITLAGPRIDDLLQKALAQGIRSLAQDPHVLAVVLTGTGPFFAAAAGPSFAAQSVLSELCQAIEAMDKPVVVALQGAAFGPGLELALSAHLRVALAGVRMGLPEVNMGLTPGAGATQRLPRLIGVDMALRLLLTGGALMAGQALAIGLVDMVVETGLEAAAVAAANSLVGQDLAPRRAVNRRDGFRDGAACVAAVSAARARVAAEPAALPAKMRMIDCVEAAMLLPFEQGLAFEAAVRHELETAPEVQGLAHAAKVERRALCLPEAFAALPRPVLQHVSLMGAGSGVVSLSYQILVAGMQLRLVDPDRERLVASLRQIAALQEAEVQAGRLTPEARDADWARLIPTLDERAALKSDLWICTPDHRLQATPEALPPVIWMAAPKDADPARITLTPGLAAGEMAEICMPQDVQSGIHAIAFAEKLRWKLVVSAGGGGIARRLRKSLAAAIAAIEAEGTPRYALAQVLSAEGLGVPLVPAARPLDVFARALADACLCALANEGALLVGEGVALRPGDVDTVAILSGLVPRRLGGPMHWADQRGLLVLRSDLRHRAASQPALYTPAPLIDRLIREERHFADLNRL